jgi:hypothetical protein
MDFSSIWSPVDNTLGTNIGGSNSTDRALRSQAEGTANANQALSNAYDQQRNALGAYRVAGEGSLSQLARGDFMNNFEANPGYQFRLNEGLDALQGSAAAKGMLNSSGTMKGMMGYAQGMASQEYDKAYDRQYNRLSQLAGIGQNANNQYVNAAGNYGAGVSANYMGMGNAGAAAEIGEANRQANLIGQGGQAAATMMSFSDERVKSDIEQVSAEDLRELKGAVKPYHFKYIDSKYGQGPWVGVMAQDLEKTKLGKTVVTKDKKGVRKVDMKKLYSILVVSLLDSEVKNAG